LAAALYSGDPGDTKNLHGSTYASLTCRITEIDGNQIHFDRPLRFDVKLAWRPQIRSFEPTVTESGVENLCFEFPNTPYGGHFTEPGYNAVAFYGAADCWARNLMITNADSGIFPNGRFCTIENIVFESAREPDTALRCTGHHGINFAGEDNLFTGFDFRTRFVHDISVGSLRLRQHHAHGKGVDLCLDHHCRAPYENLFTDIDTGAGTRLWQCGGGAALGKHCAARGTFWNIRAAVPQQYPPVAFGSASLNFVALQTELPSEKNSAGRWFEAIPPAEISPPDIHAAQLARRLGAKVISLHRHQIRLGQRKPAPCDCPQGGADDEVVRAGAVVDPEGGAAAIDGDEVGEGGFGALGLRCRLPAARGLRFRVCHEHPVMMAVVDGNVAELIIAAGAHEHAQVVRVQDGVADDIVVEVEVEEMPAPGLSCR